MKCPPDRVHHLHSLVIFKEDKGPGGIVTEGYCPGGNCPEGYCPGGIERGVLSGGYCLGCIVLDSKYAFIKPHLKKADLDEPCNYRPFANLPFLSKALKWIVHRQVTYHLVSS